MVSEYWPGKDEIPRHSTLEYTRIRWYFVLFLHEYIFSYIFFQFQGYVCKLILILLMYGYVAPVFWMFIEGLYLHSKLATNIFDSPAPFMVYYIIGWGKYLIHISTLIFKTQGFYNCLCKFFIDNVSLLIIL